MEATELLNELQKILNNKNSEENPTVAVTWDNYYKGLCGEPESNFENYASDIGLVKRG